MAKAASRRGTMVLDLANALRTQIANGDFPVGGRLPTESQLSAQHSVSRTVVREAIAALRADGLVEPRQGAGVFVLEKSAAAGLPFQNINYDRISSVIELLELRTAVEVEAAGLAAVRRSPVQEEQIIECCRAVSDLAHEGKPTSEADFALHLAIADASNNSRFREFLIMLGANVIPRRALRSADSEQVSESYLSLIEDEHQQIVNAIVDRNPDAARAAMRRHLEGSQARYRALLRDRSGIAA